MKSKAANFNNYVQSVQDPPDQSLLGALAASGMGVWCWHVKTGQVVVSKTLTDLIQLQTDNLLTYSDFIKAIHIDDRDSLNTLLQQSLGELGSHEAVFRAKTPTGETQWFVSKGLAYADADGKADHILATIQDIDEQTKTVESLIESERRYRSVVEDQTDFIVRWMPDGIRTFVNDSYCHYFEQTREQLLGTSFFPLIVPEDRERIRKKVAGLTPQHPVASAEHRSIAPNGEYRWHQWTDRAFFDEHGLVIEYQSVGRDITDTRNVDERLRKNEELLRLGLNAAKVGTWEWKIDTNEVNWSEDVETIFGLESGSFAGDYESYFQLIYPDDITKVQQAIKDSLELDKPYTIEHRVSWPDGSLHWIAGQGKVLRDEKGEPTRMLGVVMDITERKQAEDAITESKENLAKAQEISHIGSWTWNLKTQKVEWSEEMYHIYGINHEQFKENAWNIIDELTHPDDRERVRKITEDAVAHNKSISVEYRIRRSDGAERVVLGEGDLVLDNEGNPAKRVGTVQDITDRIEAKEALRLSEERFDLVIQGSTDCFWDWRDTSKDAVWVTPRFYELLGYKNDEFEMGFEKFTSLLHPEDREYTMEAVRAHLEDQKPYDVEYRLQKKSGDYIWFHARGQALWDKQGNVLRMSGSIQDISKRKQTEEQLLASEEKFSKAFRSSPDSYTITRQSDGKIVEVNEGFERIFGYSTDEVVGRSTLELNLWANPDQRQEFMELLRKQGYLRDLDVDLRNKSGEILQCQVSAESITIDDTPCMAAITRDMTERKAYLANMEYQATHDSLTGLPNREYLYKSAESAIKIARAEESMLALFLMDLDHFKEINDTLGHHSGDALLKQIGPRLQQNMAKEGALITRLGGDEFAVLIGSIDSEEQAIQCVKQALSIVKQTFDIDGLKVEIGASIGVSIYPKNGDNPSTLLRCADVAMYHAKQHSMGYALYSSDHDEYSLRRLSLMTDLGSAMRENQLFLDYQPKVTVQGNQVIGLEALVRWQHPEHGLISPDQFIPVAETGELIKPLTLWVLDNALKQLSEWHNAGFKINVAVNISTRNLIDEEFPDVVAMLIEKHGVDPAYLELEITESAIMADPERALHILTRVNDMGVQLSIDDFGTGYSSLAYLKKLPIQALKIDLSFVSNMTHSEQDRIIVQSTINLAHNLEIAVIAEGVDTLDILDSLRSYECDQAQGFYISSPMDSGGASDWLQTRH